MEMERRKIKVLWVGDYNCPTGFSEVNTNLLHRLKNDPEIDLHVLACNYHGQYPVFPSYFPVYGCYSDYAQNEIVDVFDKVKPDLLFTLNDGYVLPLYQRLLGGRLNNCWWIGYTVFDGTPIARWKDTLKHIDEVIFPTNWQKEQILKVMPELKCRTISHGVDINKFKPVEIDVIKKYKSETLGKDNNDAFVFGMVAKNFERKRYPELIQAFAIFKHKSGIKFDRNPMLVLYPTSSKGQFNLINMVNVSGCKDGDVAIVSPPDSQGLTDDEMNLLYNSFDVNCLISIGEGFGLPTINAAACGKLTIAMDNSVQSELSKYFPMCLVSTDGQSPTWFGLDMEQIRYIPDCNKLAKTMCDVYYKFQDINIVDSIKSQAIKGAKHFEWNNIAEEFRLLIKSYAGRCKKVMVI